MLPPALPRLFRLLIAAGLLAGLYGATLVVSRSRAVHDWLERRLSEAIASEVRIGSMHLGYDFALHAESFSVVAGDAPWIESQHVEVSLAPGGLFSRQPLRLTVHAPHVHLDRLPASGKDTTGGGTLPLRTLIIKDGAVHLPIGGTELEVGPLQISLTTDASSRQLELRISLPELDQQTTAMTLSAQAAGVEGTADRLADGWQIDATFAVGRLSARSSDGEEAVDKLKLNGSARGRWTQDRGLDVSVAVSAGELLWGRYYADFAAIPLTVSAQVKPTAKRIELTGLSVKAGGIGKFAGEAVVGTHATIERIAGEVEADLAPLFAVAVAEPRRESSPALASMKTEGSLRGRFDYRQARGAATIQGELRLRGSLHSESPQIELHELSLELPFQLGPRAKESSGTGELRFTELRIGDLLFPAVSAGLASGPNRIALAGPLSLPLLGGRMTLSELIAEDLDSPQRQARLGIDLQRIDLGALSSVLGWPPLEGSLDGRIPEVTIDSDSVHTRGEMRAELFGGSVEVRHLRAEQLTTGIPTLRLDLAFEDISLRKLTKALSFGRVSGVVRGAVDGLAVVHGEATEFDAWMETVRGREKQSISVKAIRQISILGGSGGDPLSGAVMRLFDEYGYSAMGFRCRLENDRFHLQGVRRKGDREYLVVGSLLPPRVDVISHTDVISFTDMVERLRRVGAEPSTPDEGAEP